MKFIDTQEALDQAVKKIAKARVLGVDTEADSLHHYYEKLCLIQISTPNDDFVIDTLANLDIKKLLTAMGEKQLIFHGADFDLRMLKRFYDFNAKSVFDTMLAAQFLGYPRPSLAALVEKHFQVNLPKSNQKADWSKRPLTPSMLDYAKNDSHYLIQIQGILMNELKSLGRLEWFEESCNSLLKIPFRKNKVGDDDLWRVKGSKDLRQREQVFLKEFWHWREKEAQRRDRPRFKVWSSDQMLQAAKWVGSSKGKDFKSCPAIPGSFNERKKLSLEKVAQKAWGIPVETVLKLKKDNTNGAKKRISNKQKVIFQSLKNSRKQIAQALRCDPSVITSNASLEALIRKSPKTLDEVRQSNILLGWQFQVAAKAYLGVLNSNHQ